LQTIFHGDAARELEDQYPRKLQHPYELFQVDSDLIRIGDMLQDTGGVHEIERGILKHAESGAILHKRNVREVSLTGTSLPQHLRRDIYANSFIKTKG
jgi:hypothetical protein